MYPDTSSAAAAAHLHQLRTDAQRSRLAALATCCQPSELARRARGLLAWVRAGQLGAGYVDPRHPQPSTRDNAYFRPCCP